MTDSCLQARVGPDTLAILKQPDVVAVNQDSLGVQARRVASTRPKNTSLVQGTALPGSISTVLTRFELDLRGHTDGTQP